MTPRPYQDAALSAIYEARQRGVKRMLLQLPVGTGKTNIFLWQVLRMRNAGIVSPQRPAVIIAHRDELLQQPYERLIAMDDMLPIGIERAERRAPADSEVIIASVQSIGRKNGRLADITPGLIIVDEAHHSAARSYHNALEKLGAFGPDGPLLIGVTATPHRADKQAIVGHEQSVYQEIVYAYGVEDAIDDGWLCAIRGYRVRTMVSLDGVHNVGGDYNQGELVEAIDDESRTRIAISRWREIAAGRSTIVFCASVDHAQHTAAQWASETGAPAYIVSGETPADERRARLSAFRDTPGAVLCNVDIASEGFDHPPVSCIVMLRPTQSWVRYMQSVGRGLRIWPGKEDCIVLDVVDNCKRHRLVNVASILDLPPAIDLEGRTLKEARDKMRVLGEHAAKSIREAGEKVTSLSEIDTLLEHVDLLARTITPVDVKAAGAKWAWLQLEDGTLQLDLGRDVDTRQERHARLATDPARRWVLFLDGFPPRQQERFGVYPMGHDLGSALRRAERGLQRLLPDIGRLVAGQASWRDLKPTSKQRYVLHKMGVAQVVIDACKTRGEATNLLRTLFVERERQRAEEMGNALLHEGTLDFGEEAFAR